MQQLINRNGKWMTQIPFYKLDRFKPMSLFTFCSIKNFDVNVKEFSDSFIYGAVTVC